MEMKFQNADKNKCDVYYEASVAGAVPIIRVIKDIEDANNIN